MYMTNKPLPKPLTIKEKSILEFLEERLSETGVSPSYQEIKDHFGFASFNSVQNYLKQLTSKGYIFAANNQKRAIQILHSASTVQEGVAKLSAVRSHPKKSPKETPRELLLQTSREEVLSLPLLGHVAAGSPIEAFEHDEFIDVPPSLVRNSDKTFALKVKGASMIEDGIFDGDIILVQKQANASNGEIVVATVDNESTVKRIYAKQEQVELRPANSTMKSMWYPPHRIQIQGVVVGLLRKF
jgi:repressor LexA